MFAHLLACWEKNVEEIISYFAIGLYLMPLVVERAENNITLHKVRTILSANKMREIDPSTSPKSARKKLSVERQKKKKRICRRRLRLPLPRARIVALKSRKKWGCSPSA